MRLLLADDHTLFRDALVQYIQRTDPEIDMVLAKDFHETSDILKARQDFDLVILDLRMPGMKGLSGLQQVRDAYPGLPVALMSGIAEPQDVREAMGMGAAGYFPKTLSGKALMKAIQLVVAGERFLPLDHETNAIMPSYRNDREETGRTNGYDIYGNGHVPANDRQQDEKIRKLTPRERDVLSFLARGLSNKEIARELDLQVVTIKLHVRGICKKLGAQNRTQAALKAREMQIV